VNCGEEVRTMRTTAYARELVKTAGVVLTLERRDDGRLWAIRGNEERSVWVRRCFPWSQPTRFISLRDSEEHEFALVREPGELSYESRSVLEGALVEAGFVLKIVRVLKVDEEVEIRNWKVETEQGPRSFQTRLDDWPRQMPGGGILIRDVAGDLYYVAEPNELDAKSRALLWAFVD
jgi:hypothetical protein